MNSDAGLTRRAATWWLGGIVGVGLALRLAGLDYGLPHVYNPDEVAIMNRALAFGTGDLDPRNFVYPTLYFYLLFAWEGLAFVAGRVTGVVGSVAEFERAFFVDPTFHYLAGRLLTALAGGATLVATYRLGGRLFGRLTGLMAAAFLAVSPIAVRDAHYVKHDVPVTLLIVVAHVLLAGLLTSPVARARHSRWLLAGAVSGAAVSTHYYAVWLAVPLLLVAWTRSPGAGGAARLRLIGSLAVVAAVAFAAGSPFLVADPATAWRDIVANREIVMDRAVAPAGVFGSLVTYLAMLATDGLTWGVAIATVVGLAAFGVVDRLRGALVWAFPAAFLLFIANTVPATRYLNPVLPLLCVVAATAVARATAAHRVPGARALWLASALAAVALVASIRGGRMFTATDTRTLALGFIEREIPAGASILVQPYSVPLRPSRAALVEGLRANLGSEDRASIKFRRMLDLDPYPAPAWRVLYLGDGGLDDEKIYVSPASLAGPDPLAPLRALGVEYVVIKRYNDDARRSIAALAAALEARGERLASFLPWRAGAVTAPIAPFLHNTDAQIDARLERPGPAIEIWRLTR